MGMGLAGMGGAAGAGDALATLFDQRLRAAADQRASQQMQIQQQEFQQNQARLDALMRIGAQEKAESTARLLQQDHDQQTTRLNTQLSAIPQGTSISAGTQQQMVQGGVLPERFQPTPITPQGPPPSLAAVDQPPAEPMPGTVANSPAPAARTFQRIPTDKETAQQKLLALFPVGSKERAAVEYNIGTGGDNIPAGLLPKQAAGVIHDTPRGLVRIAEDGTVTPLGVQGYHAPVNTEGRDLANALLADKLETTRKERATKEDSARQSTGSALELVDRMEKHPGLSMGSGYISSRFSGLSQDATDFNGLRDQLVATLALPNLGSLKGPMSDKDVVFVKLLATRLGNPLLSEQETRKALSEAKTFLLSKSESQGGSPGAAPKRVRYGMDGKPLPN